MHEQGLCSFNGSNKKTRILKPPLMHDRFEKEVQQKMGELNLTPSAPVWEKIELEIKPEKKRRRVFIWLFFGLLLLVGSGTLVFFLVNDRKEPLEQRIALNTTLKKENVTPVKPSDRSLKTTSKSNRNSNRLAVRKERRKANNITTTKNIHKPESIVTKSHSDITQTPGKKL